MRGAGWAYHDPLLLKPQGLMSRAFPRHFALMAAERPDIASAFSHRFLDIGVGVGALAVEAAEQFPNLHVTGIDIWEPSLALAREAVAASAHAHRVEIREQDVTALNEPASYSAIWFPILFFPRHVVEAAMPGIVAALREDGMLIIPRAAPPPPGLPAALARLQMLRNGGAGWTDDELTALANASGLTDVTFCPGPAMAAMPGGRLMLARKP
jgi:SAM-dependent methyltransferase